MALLLLELLYFRIADYFNIIDKPNERSSHSSVVLRGGGIIFLFGVWIWSILCLTPFSLGEESIYPWFLIAVTLVAGLSFIDDIHSLPDSIRLVCQFAGMLMIFYQLSIGNELLAAIEWPYLLLIGIVALIVMVGATNIINFMDGINGITGAYAIAVLTPLIIKNEGLNMKNGSTFIDDSFLWVVLLSVLVFCIFNFRPRGKAKCFAGDVGSISVGFILLFAIGKLIVATGDVTYLIFLVAYGVDGCLTIIHRIMLHEHLGEAHRKHAFQLMANELKMSHVTVSLFYMILQLVISLLFVLVVPDTIVAHWIFFLGIILVLCCAYVIFMKKYYHLHEEYLASLK